MRKIIALLLSGAAVITVVLCARLSGNTADIAAIGTAENVGSATDTEPLAESDIISASEGFDLKLSSINVPNPSKQDVLHMMLNSTDYYNYASGTIAYANPGDLSSSIIVEFGCDLTVGTAYSHTVQKNVSVEDISKAIREEDKSELFDTTAESTTYLADREMCCDGVSAAVVDNISRTCSLSEGAVTMRDNVSEIADEDRFSIDENGIPCYYYRANPTNVDDAGMCLLPQEMAFGFLLDLDMWEIEGSAVYDGRDCVVVSGKTADEYSNKTGVERFTFYVDKETGTLLKYVGLDSEGEISDYMISDRISFDNSFDMESDIEAVTEKMVSYTAE